MSDSANKRESKGVFSRFLRESPAVLRCNTYQWLKLLFYPAAEQPAEFAKCSRPSSDVPESHILIIAPIIPGDTLMHCLAAKVKALMS